MKKAILYIVLAIVLTGCEVIREGDRLIELPMSITGERAHVLIDYTGFRCVNCPKASAEAQELSQLYGERLIVVAMHPASNPFTQGLYDYTCPEADVYYKYMGGNASTAFPTGNIDMRSEEGIYFTDYLAWPGRLASAMKDSAKVFLSAEVSLNENTQEMRITTTAYASSTAHCRLITWLVEDSVMGVQAMPDGTINTEYAHRHVLRGAAGEAWGDSIVLTTQPARFTQTMRLPESCVRTHCEIVAVLTDEQHQILNATKSNISLQQ